ncbi:MAG: hypothetical protein ACE5GE_17445, partial [Phycisphaerae bacterium]
LYFQPGAGSHWLPEWFGLKEQLQVLTLPIILALATALHSAAARVVGGAQGASPAPEDACPGRRPAYWLGLLWIWMLLGAYLALIGPHKRLHYLAIALVPLCMLSAHGLHLFLAGARRMGSSGPPYYLFVGLLWCGYMLIVPLEDQLHALNMHHYRRLESPQANPRAILAEVIVENTSPADTLFAWGYEPEIYYRADRAPAIRYIGTEKVSQLGPAGQALLDEIITLLKASPPAALVVSLDQVDRFIAPKPGDRLDYDDLGDWLHANYTLCPQAKRENLWLRR